MKEYVIWSGGADSTCLLYELAQKSSKENPVYTLSINHPYVYDEKKQMMEKEARKKILKWMKEKGFHIIGNEVTINEKNVPLIPCEGGNQPLWWITNIIQFLPDDCKIHMGYVYEDSFWHKKAEFVKAFFALRNLKTSQDVSELYFDFEWKHKINIIKKLKKVGLLGMTWTCETPYKKSPCGKCEPCEMRKLALKTLKK